MTLDSDDGVPQASVHWWVPSGKRNCPPYPHAICVPLEEKYCSDDASF